MAAPATAADAWSVVEEFAAAMELRKIDGAAILAPLTTDANDDEAEIVENVTRDHAYAKLEEMQKTVARLSLGDDSNTAHRRPGGPRARSPPPHWAWRPPAPRTWS